jgi:hypothetical protein
VIVLKRASLFGWRESSASDAGGFAGEEVGVHVSIMAERKIGRVSRKGNRKFPPVANTLITQGVTLILAVPRRFQRFAR